MPRKPKPKMTKKAWVYTLLSAGCFGASFIWMWQIPGFLLMIPCVGFEYMALDEWWEN